MTARVFEDQADMFEVGILSQTADVQPVSTEKLLASPAGPPVVLVGGLLVADRLGDLRRLLSVLARARTAVLVVPPFTDLDIGRYFETPVQLRAQRRSAESSARIVDGATLSAIGEHMKVRSDHFFETALGAGVVAIDAQSKPVLIRYQVSNTSGPVFFSALQLLTYTALTDEGQRQALLGHLLSWTPTIANEAPAHIRGTSASPKKSSVTEDILVQVALLLAAAGSQTRDQLRTCARHVLGADLSIEDIGSALDELGRRELLEPERSERTTRAALDGFLEQRGLHAYVRELTDLLAAEKSHT